MRSIRQQLTRKLLLAVSLLILLAGWGVYASVHEALHKSFDAALRAKALAIVTATKQSDAHVHVDFTDHFMREFDDRVATDFFEMWLADGTVVKHSESGQGTDLPQKFGTPENPKYWNLTLPSGARGRAAGVRFTPQIDKGARRDQTSTATVGEVILVVASERKSLDKTLAIFALVLSSAGLLLLIATGLIVPRVLQKELLPLDQLAEQASRIDAESLSIRFETELLPTELHPIGSRLNDLLGRLEQAFDRERQFSGDLAHELRTPIAELRSLAELGLQWPQTRGAESDRDALAIAQQMEHIVTRLLALLRSENKQLIVQREPVRLAPLIQSVWSSFIAKAAEKELEVTCTIADDAVIQSDRVLLHSILSNFFDNAVEYTPQRGVVRIESEADSKRFFVRVVNTAGDLHPGDIPKIFQRFWRKDMARSGGNHSGLGLSLAKGFSQALGYELTATQDSSSGFLTITLDGAVRGPDRSILGNESNSVSEIEATGIHQ